VHVSIVSARRWALLAVAATVVAATVVIPHVAGADTVPPSGPATVSADGLPTAQIDGIAWSQTTAGNTVYVTGKFAHARPAGVALGGAGTVTRSNLMAYNITNGVMTSFNHALNAQGLVVAVSPDESTVYVGGDFTTVDGVAHSRLAAFNVATGAVIPGFAPSFNGQVRAVTVTSSAVYVGGSFSSVNGVARSRLAAVAPATGAVLDWNPGANAPVYALTNVLNGSRIIVGGMFSSLSGTPTIGMGSLDAATGGSLPWAVNQIIQNSGANATISSLTTDGVRVYGTAWQFTVGGNFEGRFAADPSTGQLLWMNNCHGDTYSATVLNGVVYSVGHNHDCADISAFPQDNVAIFSSTLHRADAESAAPTGVITRHPIFPGGNGPGPIYHDFAGQPATTQFDWYPTLTAGTISGQGQAAWSTTGNGTYLALGGEFPTVNGVAQQGLVRFAVTGAAPNKVGPVSATTLTPIVSTQDAGTLRVSWQADWDQDNTRLTYRLYRDGGAAPISTQTLDTTFYDRPYMGFLDSGLAAGSGHTYRVVVTDPFGNSRTSGTSTSVTVGSTSPSGYAATVLADGASNFWPLDEASGATSFDRAGFGNLALTGTYTRGATGPVAGQRATTFAGGETTPPQTGRFPPAPVPNNTAGTIGMVRAALPTFTVEAWVRTTSTAGGAVIADGLYQAMDSQTIDRVIFIDAAGVAHFGLQNDAAKQALTGGPAVNDGAWHLLAASYGGGESTLYVDGVAVATSSTMIDNIVYNGYWRIGGDQLAGWPGAPASNYLAGAVADAAVYPSALSAATIANHVAAATGGGVPPANTPPTAKFSLSCTTLTCTVNGGASSDTDGSITGYSWSFGDGQTGSGSNTSHTYAAAGSYTITLTVTDNDGASSSSSSSVTVSAGGGTPTVLVADAFSRTASGAWGSADTGGAWTVSGGSSAFAVASGVGVMSQKAGGTPRAVLGALNLTDTDSTVDVALDKVPGGTSISDYLYLAARRSGTSEYELRVRVLSTGAVQVSLIKNTAGTARGLQTVTVSGLTYAAATVLHLRLQVVGSASASLSGKVWTGATQPAAWTVTATDSTSALASGAPSLSTYLVNGATNAPVAARWDNLSITSA
jgi:PKD repeat protein